MLQVWPKMQFRQHYLIFAFLISALFLVANHPWWLHQGSRGLCGALAGTSHFLIPHDAGIVDTSTRASLFLILRFASFYL
jgi:hypothetical protein